MLSPIKEFLKLESAGGIMLLIAAMLAMLIANSPLAPFYDLLIGMPVEIRVGPLHIAKPLLLWVNDGLMAVFFFLVGLELKREVLEGELSSIRQIALPAIAATGGMVVPAAIYVLFNRDNPIALEGWAIPAATDIAFALGILMLLGRRVPTALKVFLVSIAIFDDMGAILIIAIFYTDGISTGPLITVMLCVATLYIFNRRYIMKLPPYILLGVVMWVAMLKSGVHATIAGVILAMFIPRHGREKSGYSPLRALEHDLHTTVAFVILPLFAFANAGITLTGIEADYLLHPVPLGITLGLFAGKQIGVFGFTWLAVKTGIAELPAEMNWKSLYGVAMLCGVGFTMSLFISSLAFEETRVNLLFDERVGIIVGSFLSGIGGYLVLKRALK